MKLQGKDGHHKKASGARQLWGGRFEGATLKEMWDYSKSIEIDFALAKHDICGSVAHVAQLERCRLMSSQLARSIQRGLIAIYRDYNKGSLSIDMNAEDIHSFIESELYARIGDKAGSLHMGRSRNDQVALDFHLYAREAIYLICIQLKDLVESLLYFAEQYKFDIIPGYTHLQRAEPIYFSHHILAYVAKFLRDMLRLQDLWKRVNICPLGAGAFSGSPLPLDNSISASLLKFSARYDNSIDAVSDRDFAVELLSALSLIQMHVSKISEEFVLWSSNEFSFIEISDEFCTGSSMMPQKKNPDLAELSRGKTGVVYGALMSLLTTLKGLPLSYNRDLQEDKEPVFRAVNVVCSTLSLFSKMVATTRLKTEHTLHCATQDYSNATELANYLTQKGMPFREAHKISGELVRVAIKDGVILNKIPLKTYQSHSKLFEGDVYAILDVHHIIETHSVKGGGSRSSILQQFKTQKKVLNTLNAWIESIRDIAQIDLLFKTLVQALGL